MQGRLVPPVEGRIQAFPVGCWEQEFANATAAGLDAIEWIYDAYGLGANPIESSEGIERVNELAAGNGVAVRSLCADYFMDFPFVRATEAERRERTERLNWLIAQASRIGVTRIVLPFVDGSAILDEADRKVVVDAVRAALPAARERAVELHLETSLSPAEFASLMEALPDTLIKVNYDSGNSASLGYVPAEEFSAYGHRIGSIHLKDRVRGGGTVPLGTGDADLKAVFEAIRRLNYAGDYVLQVARAEPGNEVAWAAHHREIVQEYLKSTHPPPTYQPTDLPTYQPADPSK